MQNQLDSFQFLTKVSVHSYALVVHFTRRQNQYTTKWVKLESIHNNVSLIHRNLISLHEHRYIAKKTVLRILENDQLNQMEKSNDIRAQNKKQAACKIISWVMDKRITIHSARISIFCSKALDASYISQMTSEHKTRSRQLVKLSAEWWIKG